MKAIFAAASVAVVFLSLVGPSQAQAQHPTISVEFNQSLLDKWLVAVPEIAKLSKSAMAPKSDDEARPHLERICADAGFNSADQCSEIIGYAGMMFGGFDPRTGKFGSPAANILRAIARMEANTKLPAADKDKKLAELREAAALMPKEFPEGHLQLMNANRDRIFETFVASAR